VEVTPATAFNAIAGWVRRRRARTASASAPVAGRTSMPSTRLSRTTAQLRARVPGNSAPGHAARRVADRDRAHRPGRVGPLPRPVSDRASRHGARRRQSTPGGDQPSGGRDASPQVGAENRRGYRPPQRERRRRHRWHRADAGEEHRPGADAAGHRHPTRSARRGPGAEGRASVALDRWATAPVAAQVSVGQPVIGHPDCPACGLPPGGPPATPAPSGPAISLSWAMHEPPVSGPVPPRDERRPCRDGTRKTISDTSTSAPPPAGLADSCCTVTTTCRSSPPSTQRPPPSS
jgi:hypothetical protein